MSKDLYNDIYDLGVLYNFENPTESIGRRRHLFTKSACENISKICLVEYRGNKKLIVKSTEKEGKLSILTWTFGIPRTAICSVLKKYRATGSVENKPRKGRKKLFTERDDNAVLWLVGKKIGCPIYVTLPINLTRRVIELLVASPSLE